MPNEIYEVRKLYSSIFESSLLKEIEEKSMIFSAGAGQGLIKMNQVIKVAENDNAPFTKFDDYKDWGRSSIESLRKESSGR